jgi:hypothetical protein
MRKHSNNKSLLPFISRKEARRQGLRSTSSANARTALIRVGLFVLAIIALGVMHAHAEPLPVPRAPGPGGSCPSGYLASGSYCVPSSSRQDAIPKPPNGSCPHGWLGSGSYCVRSGATNR